MQKKIVIMVSTRCEKCRTKAMQTAAVADGVSSVALEGEKKEKLVVVGEMVDAACLTEALRRKIRHAELLTVEEVKPKP
ncbi:heavy metal-associated isoprenylated plant protein 47-like [Mercurialis annua]|uniref:heavy metal-associated isoprenylated plant protein 47-like n=1 Tax=Mercurialis annua TaxID=3986 RepID=UPI00215E9269|nr:heavy metal-associated isoprenylated plant protein 47-like [Mercurialis annua]